MKNANPPWDPPEVMAKHVAHCLRLNTKGMTALLLPLTFLSSWERYRLVHSRWSINRLYPLAERPIFAGSGGKTDCAWFVWDPRAVWDPRRSVGHGVHVLTKEMLK